MSYIDRRLADPHFPTDPALTLFHAARHSMNLAFIAWLNTCPTPEVIALEADGTVAIIRGLVALNRGGAA
jgi:hypothetical protein